MRQIVSHLHADSAVIMSSVCSHVVSCKLYDFKCYINWEAILKLMVLY